MNVLVVDDDAAIRVSFSSLSRAPRPYGVSVVWTTAATKTEALARITADLTWALVDLSLNGEHENRDGMEVVYAILAAPTNTTRVAVLTGHEVDEELAKELFLLDVPVFHKPFAPQLLLDALVASDLRASSRVMRPSGTRLAVEALRPHAKSAPERVMLLKQAEVELALARSNGNVTHAARELGVNPQWIRRHRKST